MTTYRYCLTNGRTTLFDQKQKTDTNEQCPICGAFISKPDHTEESSVDSKKVDCGTCGNPLLHVVPLIKVTTSGVMFISDSTRYRALNNLKEDEPPLQTYQVAWIVFIAVAIGVGGIIISKLYY